MNLRTMEPFTLKDLFPKIDRLKENLSSCTECGCLVFSENMPIHVKWHNKVADL